MSRCFTCLAAFLLLPTALALEVPVLSPEQAAFCAMSACERRDVFTNVGYRARLAVAEWELLAWREARPGETSRWRRLPGVPNLRDIGGQRGMGGKSIRKGMIFRSGGYNGNACELYREDEVLRMYHDGVLLGQVPPKSLDAAKKIVQALDAGEDADLRHLPKVWRPGAVRLSEESRAYQRKMFGIRTDMDLRGEWECYGMNGSPLGPGVRFVHIPFKEYGGMQTPEGKAAFGRAFACFLESKNYPIGFHCIAGADRTGSLAYAIEALLGVSDEDLALDWELTAFFNPNPKFAHRERYDKLVAGFMSFPGASTRERVEEYVKSLGYSDTDIAAFRRMMLE